MNGRHDTVECDENREGPSRTNVEAAIQKALAGDVDSAGWIYDTFAPVVFRRLKGRYGYLDEAELEDLLQDTFVVCFRNEGRVLRRFIERTPKSDRDATAFSRFLWDQACGLVANLRRSRKQGVVVEISEVRDSMSQSRDEVRAITRDALSKLAQCLEDRGRRVYLYFVLRYVDGFSPEEISATTGWSRKVTYNLKQALNRAVDQCTEELDLLKR